MGSEMCIRDRSEEKGIQNFIARGAKKPSSKLSGHIEPINYVEIYYASNSSLAPVSQIQPINSFWQFSHIARLYFSDEWNWPGKLES